MAYDSMIVKHPVVQCKIICSERTNQVNHRQRIFVIGDLDPTAWFLGLCAWYITTLPRGTLLSRRPNVSCAFCLHNFRPQWTESMVLQIVLLSLVPCSVLSISIRTDSRQTCKRKLFPQTVAVCPQYGSGSLMVATANPSVCWNDWNDRHVITGVEAGL